MTVRAKFVVQSITRNLGYSYDYETQKNTTVEQQTITLMPVYDSDPNSDNGKFYASTPTGKIELGVVNAAAGNQFVLNGEYFVDFTPANSN